MEKKCFKCGEVKALEEFYKHKQMKDGRVNKCVSCNKDDVKNHRLGNLDKIRAYDRARGSRQTAEDTAKYRKNNPVKYAAHLLVNNHLRDGKLHKQEFCEGCGCGPTQGHHDDYAKPLEVRWLCSLCHHKWHIENGEGINAD